MQMEGTSNGKLEETREVQLQDEDKEMYIQDVGDSKPMDEFARDIDIADNSEPANKRGVKVEDFSEPADKSTDGKETEPAEKSPHQVAEEKEVLDLVIDSVDQPPVDLEYSKERNEKLLPSVDETGESSPSATDFPSKETNEKTLTPFDESNGFSPVVTDLASEASVKNDNESSPVVAQVLPKGYEGTESQAGEENTGESSFESHRETGGGECDKPEIPESTVNQVGFLAWKNSILIHKHKIFLDLQFLPCYILSYVHVIHFTHLHVDWHSVYCPCKFTPPATNFVEELLWTFRGSASI